MNKKSLRNYVAKHARQHQKAVVMKDKKREAKKMGASNKRRFGNESSFLLPVVIAFTLD